MFFRAAVIGATICATPIHADGWGGFYLGAHSTSETGFFDYLVGGVSDGSPHNMFGSTWGGFVGYNVQNGNMVYGGELSYSTGTVALENFPTYEYQTIIDVNGRLGYSSGRTLFYATAGASMGNWDNGGSGPYSANRFNYGVGVDVEITDQFFAGIKYLVRDMNGSFAPDFVNNSFENDNEPVQVRVGMKF